jgi:hypothetical protein
MPPTTDAKYMIKSKATNRAWKYNFDYKDNQACIIDFSRSCIRPGSEKKIGMHFNNTMPEYTTKSIEIIRSINTKQVASVYSLIPSDDPELLYTNTCKFIREYPIPAFNHLACIDVFRVTTAIREVYLKSNLGSSNGKLAIDMISTVIRASEHMVKDTIRRMVERPLTATEITREPLLDMINSIIDSTETGSYDAEFTKDTQCFINDDSEPIIHANVRHNASESEYLKSKFKSNNELNSEYLYYQGLQSLETVGIQTLISTRHGQKK